MQKYKIFYGNKSFREVFAEHCAAFPLLFFLRDRGFSCFFCLFPPELNLFLFDAEMEWGVAPKHLCLVDWLVGEHSSPSAPVHGRRFSECHERPIPEVVVGVDDQRWGVHCVAGWNL